MHIVKFAFECGGFDSRLMRGGLSLSAWHIATGLARRGHRVSIVTPAHGKIGYLRDRYGLEDLDYRHDYTLPLILDRRVWRGFPAVAELRLSTRASRMTCDGVDVYFLSNEHLDLLPGRLYPAGASEGRDLGFFKPLVFQIDAIRFADETFPDEELIVQTYEPLYSYLAPLAYRGQPRRPVVTTIASNMPLGLRVHRSQVEEALSILGRSLDALLPERPRRDAHLRVFDVVSLCSDGISFMSDGQRELYAASPAAGTMFVGGCGISDEWLGRDPASVDRDATLRSLGLDPELPTFLHSARYSVRHKGQVELITAIDRLLASERSANFVLRMPLGARDGRSQDVDPYFAEVAGRYPGNVHLSWEMIDNIDLYPYAAAADFCVFPSKFELDTFLIAQGEAMACGAVPIATAQRGTRHYLHHLDLEEHGATGLALRPSFADDDPLLVDDLLRQIGQAIIIFQNKPELYAKLSRNSARVARRFTWPAAVERHLRGFARVAAAGLRPCPE